MITLIARSTPRSSARVCDRSPAGARRLRRRCGFLVAQCLVGLAVLLSFNGLTIALGLISPLIVLIYPFAKRFTSWPQAILGLAFAYGALLGWTACTGELGAPALFLYAAAISWTIGFDTIYALQDLRDDAIVGVRSTARLFGPRVQLAVGALYAVSAACAAFAVFLAGGGWLAYRRGRRLCGASRMANCADPRRCRADHRSAPVPLKSRRGSAAVRRFFCAEPRLSFLEGVGRRAMRNCSTSRVPFSCRDRS